MSQTIVPTVIVSPQTERVVAISRTAQDLMDAAEQSPAVKSDLQAMFVSYSHNPIVAALASVAGILLAQQHVTVDSTALTVVIGLAVAGCGYGWQFVSMKMSKPAPK